jgi:hypothetical protein
METTDSSAAIQELTKRVRTLELDFAALCERLLAEREQHKPKPSTEKPPIDFTGVGGRRVHPPQKFDGKPTVDLSPAYGSTGRLIR